LPETLALIANCPWPGNVRELENFVHRFVVLGNAERSHQELEAALRAIRRSDPAVAPAPPPEPAPSPSTADLTRGLRAIARSAAREAEGKALREVLDRVRWNRVEAARILKVSYKTLLSKIAEGRLMEKSPQKPA